MGLYSGGIILGRILTSEIWRGRAYFCFFFGGGGLIIGIIRYVGLFHIHLLPPDDIYLLYRGGFTFGLLDCVCCNKDFVMLRYCSIHFTITLPGLKNIVCCTKDFVM